MIISCYHFYSIPNEKAEVLVFFVLRRKEWMFSVTMQFSTSLIFVSLLFKLCFRLSNRGRVFFVP